MTDRIENSFLFNKERTKSTHRSNEMKFRQFQFFQSDKNYNALSNVTNFINQAEWQRGKLSKQQIGTNETLKKKIHESSDADEISQIDQENCISSSVPRGNDSVRKSIQTLSTNAFYIPDKQQQNSTKILTTTFLPSLPMKRKFSELFVKKSKSPDEANPIEPFLAKRPRLLDMNRIRSVVLADEPTANFHIDSIPAKRRFSSDRTLFLPRLTDKDYTIQPSLSQLSCCFNEQGRCVVEKFTITRQNYGSITFFGSKIDLTQLDLNRLISIDHGQVTVYPDDNDRPDIGTELNCRAIIHLFGIYPIERPKAEKVTDPIRLKQMNYAEYLKKMTEKFNGKFLGYDFNTGSWKFQVEHF